jgi:predicted metal-dependent hydrolase
VDEKLLRRVLETPPSTPKETVYLKMVVVPIRYIIKMRRLNILQYMLHEDKDCLVNLFLKTHIEKPLNGDCGQSCKKYLEDPEIQMKIDDIEKMNRNKIRNLVKKKTMDKALQYLNQVKAKHSKVLHLTYTKLEVQKYLE